MKMIQLPRSNWMLVILMVLAAALGAATLRAVAQSVMTGPPAQQPPAAAAPADAPPGAAAPSDRGAGNPPSSTQPPSKAPPSGQGPARAPDTHGSADNNVSFPVDI
jgi:hypothetical protein